MRDESHMKYELSQAHIFPSEPILRSKDRSYLEGRTLGTGTLVHHQLVEPDHRMRRGMDMVDDHRFDDLNRVLASGTSRQSGWARICIVGRGDHSGT